METKDEQLEKILQEQTEIADWATHLLYKKLFGRMESKNLRFTEILKNLIKQTMMSVYIQAYNKGFDKCYFEYVKPLLNDKK